LIIRFLIGLLVIVLLLGLSLVMIPVDSLLKRVTDSSGISYSLAEGNLFKGRINDLSYVDTVPINLGDFNYEGSPTITGLKVSFNTDDNSTKGVIKRNLFNGNLHVKDFITEAPYKTNGLGIIEVQINIEQMTIKNGICHQIEGKLSLSNDSYKETVSGNVRCLEGNVYEVKLLDSKNNDMGLMIYRPGFIDLEIETAILKSDVSIFLGNRMGFTIPL